MSNESLPRLLTGDVVGQVDATQVPRYAGLGTFARLPFIDEVSDVDVALVGIPFDTGVSYRPGARFGPSHVRESSRLLRPFNPAGSKSPFASQQVADAGDIAANPFHIEEAIAQIERGSRDLHERAKRLITIGGDHTIALPLLRTMAAKHGPISVIDREGSIHVGIRGPLYSAKDLDQDKSLGFEIFSSIEFEDIGPQGAIDKIRDRVQNRPMYVSIDIDVLDPSHAPGTGTPEAGGLTSRELLKVIRSFGEMNIVGADVVEVAPAYDHAQMTGIAASHVIYDLLSVMAPS